MAYVNVKDWNVDQVTEWLKGLDNVIMPYAAFFFNNAVTGHQLLNLRADDLEHLGVTKIGHQETILEAVELLRNFHFELDKENLQMLALRLSCAANSLFKELVLVKDDCSTVQTQFLSDVHNIVTIIKPLVCWLDRSPFVGDKDYIDKKQQLFELGFQMATCAHRDIFAQYPVRNIRNICEELARIADYVVQEISDPMILQPASLDLATLKKKEQELGFYILPSNHGIHQIGLIKYGSPANGSSKIEPGDEIVQVNYQTVVGWQRKKVIMLLQESPPEIVLTLKKRPRHTKVHGQIFMKPYRLPSRKRDTQNWSRWKGNLPSPRLTDLPPITIPKLTTASEPEAVDIESSSDSEIPDSPLDGSIRMYPQKPKPILQRRNTITGATPTNKRPYVSIDQYWDMFKPWSGTAASSYNIDQNKSDDDTMFLRDKSISCNTGLDLSARPTTVIGGITSSGNTSSFKKNAIDKPSIKKQVNFKDCGENVINKNEEIKTETECNLNEEKSISVNSLASLSNDNIGYIDEGRELTDRTSMTSDWKKEVIDVIKEKPESNSPSQNNLKSDPNIADVNIHSIIKKFDEQQTLDAAPPRVPKPKTLPRLQISKPHKEITKPAVPPRTAITKIRGRLDKSHSTPAYDLTEEDTAVIDRTSNDKLPDLISDISDTIKESEPIPYTETVYMLGIPIVETSSPVEEAGNIEIDDELPPKPPPRTFGVELFKPVYPADSPKPLVTPKLDALPKVFEFPDTQQHLSKSPEQVLQTFHDEKPPRSFEPNMVSTPVTKTPKMDFSDIDSYKGSSISNYEMQKSISEMKISPTNSIVKGFMSGKNKSAGKKKNTLIGKRRKVSVNELSPADIQGFLYQRFRGKHNKNVHWEKRLFILLGNCLYGFKTKDDTRAACLIFLSGFTVALASEVKSRPNAFKVYHTGTFFYFSADDADALQSWIELIKAATLHNDASRPTDSNLYSETDESDTEKPKTPSNEKHDSLKKFGSLKKFSSSNKNKEPTGGGGSTSLDRKWFFNKSSGHSKNLIPVPTAQFRSYRKMRAPDIMASVTTDNFTSHVPLFTSPQNASVPNLTVESISPSTCSKNINRDKMKNYMHTSNQSLCNINEFDVPAFKKKTPQQRNDNLAGFVTLEELMIRQTEERKLNPHHIVEEMANNLRLIKPDVVYGEIPIRPKEQFTEDKPEASIEPSYSKSSSTSSKPTEKSNTGSSCFGKRLGSLKKAHHKEDEYDGKTSTYPKTAKGFDHKMNRSLPRTHKVQDQYRPREEYNINHYGSDRNLAHNYDESSYKMIHCQKMVNDVHFAQNRILDDRLYNENPKKLQKLKKQNSFSDKKSSKADSLKFGNKISDVSSTKVKLKSAIHYTPISLPLSQDPKAKPRFAFELNLDEKNAKSVKKKKAFLGSPKLRKAFFKNPSPASGAGSDLAFNSNFPTKDVAMIYPMENSPPVPSVPLPMSVHTLVDYPGMEYPPIFEPETYTLADPQSSLSILRKQGKKE